MGMLYLVSSCLFFVSPVINGSRNQLGADNHAVTDDETMPYISVTQAGAAVRSKAGKPKGI